MVIRTCLLRTHRLEEHNFVAEGVFNGGFPMSPRRFLNAGLGILVILFDQGADEFVQTRHLNVHGRTGTTIPVMFRELQDTTVTGELHEHGAVVTEACLEVHFEAEELVSFGTALAKQKCPWLSDEDLEDAAVNAFLEIQRQIKTIPTESDFRARFTECVRYRALDEAEKETERKAFARKLEGSPADLGDSYEEREGEKTLPYSSILKAEDRQTIIAALNKLMPADKLLLYDWCGLELKQREIAAKYGWGVSSVSARIEGALKRAREVLSSDPTLKDLPGIDHD